MTTIGIRARLKLKYKNSELNTEKINLNDLSND